jgi:hypothetical protein
MDGWMDGWREGGREGAVRKRGAGGENRREQGLGQGRGSHKRTGFGTECRSQRACDASRTSAPGARAREQGRAWEQGWRHAWHHVMAREQAPHDVGTHGVGRQRRRPTQGRQMTPATPKYREADCASGSRAGVWVCEDGDCRDTCEHGGCRAWRAARDPPCLCPLSPTRRWPRAKGHATDMQQTCNRHATDMQQTWHLAPRVIWRTLHEFQVASACMPWYL